MEKASFYRYRGICYTSIGTDVDDHKLPCRFMRTVLGSVCIKIIACLPLTTVFIKYYTESDKVIQG